MSNYCQRNVLNHLKIKRCIKSCRKQLSNGRNIKQILQEVVSVPSIRLRGDKENNKFDFQPMCFLWGTVGSLESSKDACFPLRTFDCQYRLCDMAEKQQDKWTKIVLEKIDQVVALLAADTFYHQMCNVNFRASRNIPLKYATLSNPKRRKFWKTYWSDSVFFLSSRLVLLLYI